MTDALPADTTFRAVLEHLPDPVLVVRGEPGAAADIVWGNACARELFRISPGGPLESAIRQPRVLEAVDTALGASVPSDVAFETIGVQPRSWHASVRPLESGEVFVVLRDETDARRTERMRADFMANASHELRTPLASLAGFVETLRTHAKDDPEARERFLAIMDEQAGRMRRLIDDLLSLSRIEMNEHVPPSDEVDLAGVVQDVTSASAPILAARRMAFEIEGKGPLPVVGDYDQLVQVVQNLIDNAVKYSPDGARIRVVMANASAEQSRTPRREDTVSLSLLSPAGDAEERFGAVWVTDQGPGVARQHLPRLSERFYRVGGQRTPGTGLGLAIVKHVVNRHRGGLVVESAEGAGTTFCAYFPATA